MSNGRTANDGNSGTVGLDEVIGELVGLEVGAVVGFAVGVGVEIGLLILGV